MNALSSSSAMGLNANIHCEKPISLSVQLSCKAGELIAITGPSGSGKSTVLRALAGIHPVDKGRVECGGVVWFQQRDKKTRIQLTPQQRHIGMVFQHYALFPHLTALQNVMLTAYGENRLQRKQQALDWLARTNLTGLEHRRPTALSGGQKQRLALARALARSPSALLLDEPFSAVDQQTRQRLYQELSSLRRELEIPMLLVTHDLSEVQQLADSVCLMHQGQVVQTGTVNDVFARPQSSLAARLLGQSNVFRGKVSANNQVNCRIGNIECNTENFSVGDSVVMMVPASAIVLHRQNRPSRGERENPVTAELATCVLLGDECALTLKPISQTEPNDRRQETLQFRLSQHVFKRNEVAVGQSLTVSLIADAIQVMAN